MNALKAAAHFVAALPPDSLSPETTEGRDGFVHPWRASGNSEVFTLVMILRAFDDDSLEEKEQLVRRLADEAVAAYPGSSVEIEVTEQYRNMKEYLDDHPQVLDKAIEAVRRTGIEPTLHEIRGGTDGSRLSERGLPTPNLPTGGHDFHSRSEWLLRRRPRRRGRDGRAPRRDLGGVRVADGTRTHDNRDHNPGLYQLSYRHRARLILALPLLPSPRGRL